MSGSAAPQGRAGSGQICGPPLREQTSPRKRLELLAWRVPALEVAQVEPVEDGATDLHQRVGALASPEHVAVPFQALANQIVNDGLCARGRDRKVKRASTCVVDEQAKQPRK